MNAVAGGGSFVSFPALVFAGVPPVLANASSTVALFPGALATMWVMRRDIARWRGLTLRLLLPVSLAGGLAGAALLLVTPAKSFDAVIPWLMLAATLTFAFGARAGAALRRHVRISSAALLVLQFVLGIYGGYFGAAVGIMLMAGWSLVGGAQTAGGDLKAIAPVRVLLVGSMNGMAVLTFIGAGAVRWPQTLVMLVAAIAGGWAGARLAQRLTSRQTRTFVLVVTSVMTAAFFWRGT